MERGAVWCVWCVCVVLLLTGARAYYQDGEYWESPEEAALYPYVVGLAREIPTIIGRLMTEEEVVPGWGEEGREELARYVVGVEEDPATTQACDDCRLIVGTVQLLVNAGGTYESLKNLTMNICYNLSIAEGMDPDMLCEGALDNYGPHVVTILNVTDKSPLDICLQMNECRPDEDPLLDRAGHLTAPYPARRRRATGKKRDLEGALRVLHITDIHIDEFYAQGEAMRWGDYLCNIPYVTMQHYFSWLTGLEPDLIIFTGDSPPHTVWLETQAGQLNVSEQVALHLKQYFPDVPAYTTIGNHEMYPTNLYYRPRPEIEELNVELRRYWQELSRFGDEQVATFDEAGYFSVENRPGLRVMGYNTNYGATSNFYNVLNDDTAPEMVAMRAYLEAELQSARDNGDKVIFIGHHPTGGGGSINYEATYVTELLAEYGDVIVFYLLGHNHGDEFRLIRDVETGETRTVSITSPSMNSKTNINPAARLFYLDPDTFTPLDADVFFVDLAQHGDSEELQVELMYRSTEEYDMEDLTAASYDDFVQRMRVDPDLIMKFNYNRRTRTSPPSPCTGNCVRDTICTVSNTINTLQRQCRAQWPDHDDEDDDDDNQ